MLNVTPWLLIWWNETHYFDQFKEIFKDDNNKIILPDDGKEVIIYTNSDNNIYHIWRGGGYEGLDIRDFNFNDPKFYRRAQRILWIRYILENQSLRKVFYDTKNNTLCFISRELEYTVVLWKIKNTHYKLVTAFHTFNSTRYDTDERFEKYTFEQ